MDFRLSDEEKIILLKTARESMTSHLEGRKPDYPDPTPGLQVACGAFVTLHARGALRGCIGHVVGDLPLFETVKEMAFASAFQDPRFSAMVRAELKRIDIEISVLSPLETITDPSKIEVGKHGIILRGHGRSGLLLPQVATEQDWDRDTFLTQTCYKAGLPDGAWRDGSTQVQIFSAIVFGEKGLGLVP